MLALAALGAVIISLWTWHWQMAMTAILLVTLCVEIKILRRVRDADVLVNPTHCLISTQVTLTLGPLLRWWTLHRATCPLDHVLASYLLGLFLLSTVATIMGLTFGTLAALVVSPISMLAGSAAWRLGVICDGIARWSAFCFVEEMWLLYAPVWKSKFYGAFHASDATPARRRGDAGSSPLDRARTAAPSPRNDLVKNWCTRRTV
jgi:hypothetical protein